ncbi:hypothetical protein [Halorussus litoreus]|uniref:hypothetical protein n=1 Tax=Halorussus litoreus TaxID=1710536 RepID=UPI0013004AE6|nr:hypothetical protein [Halorussus litoreus]
MLRTTRRFALKLVGGGTASVMGSGVAAKGRTETEAVERQNQSSRVLPPPQKVLKDAQAAGERTSSADITEPAVNVVLPEMDDDPDVRRTDEGYAGEHAGQLGRLAAAVAVVDADVRLHYPGPDTDAAGPWFVLEPLSGQLSTVQAGTGRVQVTMDYREFAGESDGEFSDCLTEVRAASDLSHPYYPVDRAVFTTGMMSFTLSDVETAAETLTVTFDVSTTPATTAESVEDRFASLDCVRDVSYESVVDVARANPSTEVRDAVERAHRSVLGVATYEWQPTPTRFGSLPQEKIAFGLGGAGATEFSNGEYASCVDVLSESVTNLGEIE